MLFENKLLRDGGNIQPNECTLFSATLFGGGTFQETTVYFIRLKTSTVTWLRRQHKSMYSVQRTVGTH